MSKPFSTIPPTSNAASYAVPYDPNQYFSVPQPAFNPTQQTYANYATTPYATTATGKKKDEQIVQSNRKFLCFF